MDLQRTFQNEASSLRYLVLDEAYADIAVEPQIHCLVLEHNMPPTGNRLTMMFSATFPKNYRKGQMHFLTEGYPVASIHGNKSVGKRMLYGFFDQVIGLFLQPQLGQLFLAVHVMRF
ncbi:uncharacterized protein LOC143243996 isoform X2 [Tachypleus tridentatus]